MTGSRSCFRRSAETALAHLAVYRAGLVAVPLFVLFGPDALEYRLANSGARVLITDDTNWPKVAEIRDRLPDLRAAIVVGGRGIDGTIDFEAALAGGSSRFRGRPTRCRRSGDHHLHVGDDRTAQGRPARPSRPPRPSARRAGAA